VEFDRFEFKGGLFNQLGSWSAHHAACRKATDDNRMADAFGMSRRIGERGDAADGCPEKHEAANPAGFNHGFEILLPLPIPPAHDERPSC
jgi:hypothetical protein